MGIFSVITLLGGLAFFLYGMSVMSGGLEKMTGGKLEKALNQLTSNPAKGLLLGMGITIAIQSSSAMTVMLVGLVNSGVMQFSQTVSVIMGSNIGTTLTAWILSLMGINSENIFLKLLTPEAFSPIAALVGIILIMASKRARKRDIGTILVGFSVLMYGMALMSDAMAPLAEAPEFARLLTAFNNPLLGVLVGTLFTGIIQSSAASVGILQALSLTGSISYGMAIPVILGQNIGTCVTAMLSSIGVSKNAKRVAALHISFNSIGTAVFITLLYGTGVLGRIEMFGGPINPVGIAMVHSAFNIFTTAMLLPFKKQLITIAEHLVPGEEKKTGAILIDERLLNTPSFAISECTNVCAKMADLAMDTVKSALTLAEKYDNAVFNKIKENEDLIDVYEDKLGDYLVKLSSKSLSVADSKRTARLLHCIGDFERMGDHAVNLAETGEEIYGKGIAFSPEANAELRVLRAALGEILEITARAFKLNDISLALDVEPLEEWIDELIMEIKANHIRRLQNGVCTIELGFVLSDLLTNYERLSDHCSNIAVALIEESQDRFDAHEYITSVKSPDNTEFKRKYDAYREKYRV